MKKKLVMLIIGIFLVLTLSFFMTSSMTGVAESQSESFQMDGDVLMKYLGTEELVNVPGNVKVIASGAFEDNDYIQKVVLPEGLETIEYNAFTECNELLEIDIPDSVTKIGSAAFANCKSLCDVSFGKGLTDIGSGVFAGCSSLADIDVSEKSTTFTCLDGVLYNADRTIIYEMLPGREKPFYIMNDRVVEIKQYAFWGCDNLEHVILADNMESIAPYAFSNASNLKTVSMSFAMKEINMKAFEDCVSLEQIYIPESIEYIHPNAFDGCGKVCFYTSSASYGYDFAEENSIETMSSPVYSLSYAEEVKDEYNEAIKEAEETAKQEALAPQEIEVGSDVIGYTTIVGNHAVILMDSAIANVVAGEQVEFNDDLRAYAQDGIIPENAFYGKSSLGNVTVPAGVSEIGKFAFARSDVSSVVMEEGTTTIGYAAFYHCDSLEEIVIPSTVTDIGARAFEYTPWLENWYENGESDYLIVGDGVLVAYKCSDENFVLPEEVKTVACSIPQS